VTRKHTEHLPLLPFPQVIFVEDCIGEPVSKAVAGMANGEVRRRRVVLV